MPPPDWLTREQIDQVIESVAAADIIDGTAAGLSEAALAGAAFDSAGARLHLTNGDRATEHLRIGDLKYMAEKFSEVVNIDNPLSAGGSEQPESPATGESVSQT